MKTTNFFSAISLVLIFTANSLFANRISDPGSSTMQKQVTYEVKVNFEASFPGASAHYMIVITDEHSRKVVPAQAYHPGISLYTFKEAGTFRGTRVAVMVPYPAIPTAWGIPPSILRGVFTGGTTYHFELTPVSNSNGL